VTNTESDPYRCGQLYASLEALFIIGTGDRTLSRPEVFARASRAPSAELRRHLRSAGEQVDEAKRKKPEQAAAAAEVFAEIPGFIPLGGIPKGGFDNSRSQDFNDGRCSQISAYKAKFTSFLA
jgi:hypothetical protein